MPSSVKAILNIQVAAEPGCTEPMAIALGAAAVSVLPAKSGAGSGNHGLTAILPIVAIDPYIDVNHRAVLESIGLSHIITAIVKAHTGRLSAICGCSVAGDGRPFTIYRKENAR